MVERKPLNLNIYARHLSGLDNVRVLLSHTDNEHFLLHMPTKQLCMAKVQMRPEITEYS